MGDTRTFGGQTHLFGKEAIHRETRHLGRPLLPLYPSLLRARVRGTMAASTSVDTLVRLGLPELGPEAAPSRSATRGGGPWAGAPHAPSADYERAATDTWAGATRTRTEIAPRQAHTQRPATFQVASGAWAGRSIFENQ
mmetsp:Transcript_27035/g.63314  ORF Transcript_27035/g.63314 Transcript_27035/m.63314 type:complete len:139 (-) Transcript_27035:151-567(-)